MVYFYAALLTLLNLVWLAMVPFAMPGNWLMVISAAFFAWITKPHEMITIYTLISITVLALIGEIIEFLAGLCGARKAGASFVASIGAIIGAISGALIGTIFIPIPLIGTIIGGCLGAGTGTWIIEMILGKPHHQSIKSGIGAGLGQFAGTTSKFVIGILIFITITLALIIP